MTMKEIINKQKKLEESLDVIYRNLVKRIKRLEQKDSYYPTEEEIRDIKVGGTD